MTLFGNTSLILSHIRKSFILGDDSGICERIVANEQISNAYIDGILSSECPDLPIIDTRNPDFYGESPEILLKVNKSFRPSRVEDRLEEFRLEKASERRAINISTKEMKIPVLSDAELMDLFSRVDKAQPNRRRKLGIAALESSPPPSPSPSPAVALSKTRGSMLTKLLLEGKTQPATAVNPFTDYSRFDGHHLLPHDSLPVKANVNKPFGGGYRLTHTLQPAPVRVYLCYLEPDVEISKLKPLLLHPIRGVKVAEMLGLAHYQYVKEARKPTIENTSLSNLEVFPYDEESKELECDFSSLEEKDELSKYQFEAFAVVEKSIAPNHRGQNSLRVPATTDGQISGRTSSSMNDVFVTIHLPQGRSKIAFSPEATLQEVLERVIKRRGLHQLEGYEYRLEPPDQVEAKLDLSLRLSETAMRVFTLRREQSRRDPITQGEYSPDENEEEQNPSNTVLPTLPVNNASNNPAAFGVNSQENLSQRQYRVQLKKGIINRDVYLIVSQVQVEVAPVSSRTPWQRKKKSRIYPIHLIAHCEYHEPRERASVRKVPFKIFYLASDSSSAEAFAMHNPTTQQQIANNWVEELQTLVFEAQWSTTRNVQMKLNAILDFVASPLREYYVQHFQDTIVR